MNSARQSRKWWVKNRTLKRIEHTGQKLIFQWQLRMVVRESLRNFRSMGRRDFQEWKNQNQCQMGQNSQEYSAIKCHLIYQQVPQNANFQLRQSNGDSIWREQFIRSFNNYLLSSYSESGSVLSTGIVTEKRTEKSLHPNMGDFKKTKNDKYVVA